MNYVKYSHCSALKSRTRTILTGSDLRPETYVFLGRTYGLQKDKQTKIGRKAQKTTEVRKELSNG